MHKNEPVVGLENCSEEDEEDEEEDDEEEEEECKFSVAIIFLPIYRFLVIKLFMVFPSRAQVTPGTRFFVRNAFVRRLFCRIFLSSYHYQINKKDTAK
jgi:hypothetical protein